MKTDEYPNRIAKKLCHVLIKMIPDNEWRATYDMDNLKSDMSDKNGDDTNETSGIFSIRNYKI